MHDRVSLTKRLIESLPTPTNGQRPIVYDQTARGLAVVVQPSGKRSFIWLRKVRGKVVWKNIADWPDYTVERARAAAGEWNTKLAKWKDSGYVGPSPFAVSPTQELTLSGLMQEYIARQLQPHAKNPARAENDLRWMVGKYLQDWKDRRLGDITAEEISAWHLYAGKKHGHRTANQVIKTLRTLYRFAVRSRLYKGDIPTAGAVFYHENKRDRYLRPDELARLWAALAKSPSRDLQDAVNLLLLTGVRKGDLFSMRWSNVSLAEKFWTVPNPKSRTPYHVPLMDEALEILRARAATATAGCDWVFPGVGESGHLTDLKKRWRELLVSAGLAYPKEPERRPTLHDLRRTAASYMAANGASLPVIARFLGHQSTAATQIYARVDLSAVRAELEAAQRVIGAGKRLKAAPQVARA